ncbi:MAG: hypothetical protein RJA44_2251 [Pseudomonadota bacterium]
MKLLDLTHYEEAVLPRLHSIYRLQRTRRSPSTVSIGPLRLPPTGLLTGRFDLPDVPVGYFGESPQTAAYETVARREAERLSIADLRQRSLLWVQLTQPVRLLDLRPHAASWPVLMSLRLAQMQELALDARRQGFDGVLYRSAQHYGHDCCALFGAALEVVRRVESQPLVEARTGALHRLVADVQRGSRLPLTP